MTVSLNVALDVWDFQHFFGRRPVTAVDWAARFRPGVQSDSVERAWYRLRAQWAEEGVPFDVVPDPDPRSELSTSALCIRLRPSIDAWLLEIFPDAD